jgi:serine/threonine protein kinase
MQEHVILEGRYSITRCLMQRPRLNLYLGRRLSVEKQLSSFLNDLPNQNEQVYEPLVAIRELVLTGLPSQMRMLIEAAAFEEFVAPSVFGSSHLPTTGDRVWIEGERHYLVMQLTDAKMPQYDAAIPLDMLLLAHALWPEWIDTVTALHWATQLCRMVAHLHRQGVVLGMLTPSIILVNGQGEAAWSPVLLPCWPPAPIYWKTPTIDVTHTHTQIFPIADKPDTSVFAAPELLNGIADERSDVYSLGAILYLLLTHFAPIAPTRRQHAHLPVRKAQRGGTILMQEHVEGLELIPLRFLNENISPLVEQIVLRALELDPTKRYQSAFEFVEALEGIV